MIPIFSLFFKEIEEEKISTKMCQDLENEMKKFSKTNNIYRSLLYDYNLFCRNKKNKK